MAIDEPPSEGGEMVERGFNPSQAELNFSRLKSEASFEVYERRLTLIDSITLTLQNQLDIQLAIQQYSFSQGVWQESAGPFDPLLSGLDSFTVSQNEQDSGTPLKTCRGGHNTLLTAMASKKTRLGTTYAFSVKVDQIFNPAMIPTKLNTAVIAFSVQQPILRGLIYGKDTVVERANLLESEATYFDSLQEISQRIFNTAVLYWELVAAKETHNILKHTVQNYIELIEKIKKLIAQDELAASDIYQPLAQLASKKIDLESSRQAYYKAFEDLKFAMNIIDEQPCAEEEFFSLDEFPSTEYSPEEFTKIQCLLLKRAASMRYDLIAAKKRETAANILVQGAENGLLPQLDLVAGFTQSNFEMNEKAKPLFRALYGGPPERDWSIGMSLSVPFYNDAAKGVLRQTQARRTQAKIRVHQLIQLSLRDLREALSDQATLAINLKESHEAVKDNQILIKNETKKLEAGFSTLFFLIDFENRLTDSLIQQVTIQKSLLQNIARLRFLSATLFIDQGDVDTILPENLSSLQFCDEQEVNLF